MFYDNHSLSIDKKLKLNTVKLKSTSSYSLSKSTLKIFNVLLILPLLKIDVKY